MRGIWRVSAPFDKVIVFKRRIHGIFVDSFCSMLGAGQDPNNFLMRIEDTFAYAYLPRSRCSRDASVGTVARLPELSFSKL